MQLPVLIIIPHGGIRVPEELEGYSVMSDFDLFYQADTCANDLFSFDAGVVGKIDTYISRFFVDPDRAYTALPPSVRDGVIKKLDYNDKNIYRHETFPDEIAISNILKRYYFPFHDSIEKVLAKNSIKLIIECHTMMPIGPQVAQDRGKPRPLISIDSTIMKNGKAVSTCPEEITAALLANLKKNFAHEDATVTEKCSLREKPVEGEIMKMYSQQDIPMLRLSLSKSLFINDSHFSYEYLRVDELRIKELKERLWNAIEKSCDKLP